MGKKERRRAAKAPTATPAVVDESNAVFNEGNFMRDEIDEHLMERDVIRFDGDSESEGDEDLDTEEVLQLPDSEEEDEDDSEEDLRERDFEEIEDELRVNDKAWGKKKSVYYEEGDEEDLSSAAEEEMEEEEAREAMVLQKRLLENLSDDKFKLDRYKYDALETDVKEVVIETDFRNMSRDEKLIYLMKHSPELPEMLEEFREKLGEAREPLYPLLQLGRQTGKFSDSGHSYIEAKYKLNLLYCLNIGFYLMLQSSENKATVMDHPVIGKMVELRKMLTNCAKTDVTLEKEIEHLLHSTDETSSKERKRSLSTESEAAVSEDLYEKQAKITAEKKSKRKKKKTGIEIASEDPTIMTEEADKRGITYKIMKNKGLTPHRKKEQRNPRVKHRNKFNKALKKRRSQVPDMRIQGGTYSGEKSGIKSSLTKSTALR